MISPSVTISRFSLGISRPDHRFAGNDLDDAHADGGQRARQILDRLLIWLTLTPGAGRSSKRVITGPGLHRHHLGLDAEIPQLQLHQPRHRLQRLVRIRLLARPRLIEQRQRRQLARISAHRTAAPGVRARPARSSRHRRSRLDARRRPARDLLLLLAHDLLARLFALLAARRARAAARFVRVPTRCRRAPRRRAGP